MTFFDSENKAKTKNLKLAASWTLFFFLMSGPVTPSWAYVPPPTGTYTQQNQQPVAEAPADEVEAAPSPTVAAPVNSGAAAAAPAPTSMDGMMGDDFALKPATEDSGVEETVSKVVAADSSETTVGDENLKTQAVISDEAPVDGLNRLAPRTFASPQDAFSGGAIPGDVINNIPFDSEGTTTIRIDKVTSNQDGTTTYRGWFLDEIGGAADVTVRPEADGTVTFEINTPDEMSATYKALGMNTQLDLNNPGNVSTGDFSEYINQINAALALIGSAPISLSPFQMDALAVLFAPSPNAEQIAIPAKIKNDDAIEEVDEEGKPEVAPEAAEVDEIEEAEEAFVTIEQEIENADAADTVSQVDEVDDRNFEVELAALSELPEDNEEMRGSNTYPKDLSAAAADLANDASRPTVLEGTGLFGWLKEGANEAESLTYELLLTGKEQFFVKAGEEEEKPAPIPASLLADAIKAFPDFFKIQDPAVLLGRLNVAYGKLLEALKGNSRNDLVKIQDQLFAKIKTLKGDEKEKSEIALQLIISRINFIDELKGLGLKPTDADSYTGLLDKMKALLDAERKKEKNEKKIGELELKTARIAALYLKSVIAYKSNSNNPAKCVGTSCDENKANCEGYTLMQNIAFSYLSIESGYFSGFTSGDDKVGHIASVIQTKDGKFWIIDQGGKPVEIDPKNLPKTLKVGGLEYVFDARSELMIGKKPMEMIAALAVKNLIAVAKQILVSGDTKKALEYAEAALKVAKLENGPGADIKVGVKLTITTTQGEKKTVETIDASLQQYVDYLKQKASAPTPKEPGKKFPIADIMKMANAKDYDGAIKAAQDAKDSFGGIILTFTKLDKTQVKREFKDIDSLVKHFQAKKALSESLAALRKNDFDAARTAAASAKALDAELLCGISSGEKKIADTIDEWIEYLKDKK